MAKVLFGSTYYLRMDPKQWETMQPYAPLGTLYAAGYLRTHGYDVALFDAMLADSVERWDQALVRHRPYLAVLYEDHFNYLSKMCLLRVREATVAMIQMAKARGCIVIVSGADATDRPDLYLRQGADYVILGEGEVTLRELTDALMGRNPRDPATIRGLAFFRNGTVCRTAPRPVITDLDRLPFPAWDLVDVDQYRTIWRRRHGYFSMNIVASRGCPFHCNWCAKPIWGQRYNVRSPENVVAEMKWLQAAYGPDHLWFMDDILGLTPGWLPRFAELVEAHGVRIPFKCLNRADLLLRNGNIEALHRAGCQIVWIGAESGSQAILNAMEKGIRVEQIIEATRRLRAVGIQVAFFLQFGYPGETWDDIRATFRLVRTCRPDDIGVSVSYPLPGTKFYERIKDQLGVRQNWIDSGDLAMLYRGPFSTAFYRQLHRVLHKEFRIRKYTREIFEGLRRPRRFNRRHLRRLIQVIRYLVTLPLDRLRLYRLRRQPHRGIGPLPIELDFEAAATPTPQSDRNHAPA